MFDFIQKFYDGDGNRDASLLKLLPKNYSYNNLTKLSFEAAHQKSDMIFSCKWDGKDCKHMFYTTQTDLGLCYTFNNKTISVTESGRANSLSLVVNIEEYEHMPGFNNEAGIKIYLHENHKKPLVSDLGYAIAPGMYTMMSVKRKETHSLTSPFGHCKDSTFTSHAECVDYCKILKVTEKCSCLSSLTYYEKDSNLAKNLTFCNFNKHFLCFEDEILKLNSKELKCLCSVPCFQVHYEPSLSSSTMSKYSANKILLNQFNVKNSIQYDLRTSLEYAETLETVKRITNQQIFGPFIEKLKYYSSNLNMLLSLFDNSFYQTNGTSLFYDFEQSFFHDYDFIRSQTIYIQQARFSTGQNYITNNLTASYEIVSKMEAKYFLKIGFRSVTSILSKCMDTEKDDINIILNCMKITKSQLISSLKYGVSGTMNKKDDILEIYYLLKDNIATFDDIVLTIFDENFYEKKKLEYIKNCTKKLTKINRYSNILNKSVKLINTKNSEDEQVKGILNFIFFIRSTKKFMQNYSFNFFCYFNSKFLKSNRFDEYLASMENLFSRYKDYERKMKVYGNTWTIISNTNIPTLENFRIKIQNFLVKTKITETATKFQIHDFMTKNEILEKLHDLRNFLSLIDNFQTEFEDFYVDIYSLFSPLSEAYWEYLIQPLPPSLKLYSFAAKSNITMDENPCKTHYSTMKHLNKCFIGLAKSVISNVFDKKILLKSKISALISSFWDVEKDLKEFYKDATVDGDFFL